MVRIITQLLLWVLLEFTGYSDLADYCEYLLSDATIVVGLTGCYPMCYYSSTTLE